MVTKILLAVGAYAPVDPEAYHAHMIWLGNELQCLMATADERQVQLGLCVWIRTPLEIFRSEAVTDAIEGKADYILFLDDDVLPQFERGKSTLKRWLELRVDVVAGIVHQRKAPYYPMLYRLNAEGAMNPIVKWPENSVGEIDACHLAFTLVSVAALQKLMMAGIDPFRIPGVGSDDIKLCRALRHLGMKVCADSAVSGIHLGNRARIDRAAMERHPLFQAEQSLRS